ncbi:MAG: bifunctional UDP-4-keto-pentose/UDP-xylose synthase, partial [Syntrophales bacterium LBB04]|nr:bifunctional UDP-4-keto-pentose/UDP-xylose synthase [Syntrophales bacterium LBB04]
MNVLILGVNGFIGHHLTNRILAETDWSVYGMDLSDERLGKSLDNPRFHFIEGDISINREWIEYHVKKCDVVMPLVAIATPKLYVEDPLAVFNLDFEMNLNIIRQCVKYHRRVVFPSTSEVYGACPEAEFKEDESFLVVGPIRKERWIYSASKQLLDRVIYAYGTRGHFDFTLFRPFNWVGPRLDSLYAAKEGSSRVVTQFIAELLLKRPPKLGDGGMQKLCYTYVDDGIAALLKILENKDDPCKNEIINIGNPDNECSVKELAALLKQIFVSHPDHKNDGEYSEIMDISQETYYGKGYQDINSRKPSIEKAKKQLIWTPEIGL